jgi:hypothetical protein
MGNVEAFERIFMDYWSRREDVAKYLVSLSSASIVSTVSLLRAAEKTGPGLWIQISWGAFSLVVLLGSLVLALSLRLRSASIRAFDKRHEIDVLLTTTFDSPEALLDAFGQIVVAVLAPSQRLHRRVDRLQYGMYAAFTLGVAALAIAGARP